MLSRQRIVSENALTIETPEEFFSTQVSVVYDARDLTEVIVWLLRSAGYRVLATTSRPVIEWLLGRDHPVMVVCDLPNPIFDSWDMLAFSHSRNPHVPILIVSGGTFRKRPELESWACCFPRRRLDTARFRSDIQHRISHVGRAS